MSASVSAVTGWVDKWMKVDYSQLAAPERSPDLDSHQVRIEAWVVDREAVLRDTVPGHPRRKRLLQVDDWTMEFMDRVAKAAEEEPITELRTNLQETKSSFDQACKQLFVKVKFDVDAVKAAADKAWVTCTTKMQLAVNAVTSQQQQLCDRVELEKLADKINEECAKG